MYPAWHHCWTIGVKLPEDVPIVGDHFQSAGYESILVGKAHFQPLASKPGSESIECQPIMRDLDFWRGFHGPWYGFNHVETARMHGHEHHAGQHYGIWLEEKGLHNWREYFQAVPPEVNPKYEDPAYTSGGIAWDLPEELHHSAWVAERTLANIDRCKAADKPFFLWSSFLDPHPPYIVPEPWASMYDPADMEPGRFVDGEFDRMPPQFRKTREEHPDFSMYEEPGGNSLHGFHSHVCDETRLRRSMATYYGMTSLMDREIGRILDGLDARGIADNTLIVFSTDHGHFLGEHGLIGKGAFHYEDLLRIPMIARFPGRIPAGEVSSSLQSQVDFAPTFLDAAGMEVPGIMQGVSQWPSWCGNAPPPRDHAIVENRHNPTTVHLRTYVDSRYKITVYRNADYGELFDLREDPGEIDNKWDDPAFREIKAGLLHKFVQAEIQREPTRMPRIAHA